jgi:hypothetical protein
MTDASHLELLASYEEALEAARRSLTIARELAEAHRSGQRPHEAALTTYLASIERDEDTVQGLRAKVAQFKGLFKTH